MAPAKFVYVLMEICFNDVNYWALCIACSNLHFDKKVRYKAKVCSQSLQPKFAAKVCSQGLQPKSAAKVCSQNLQPKSAAKASSLCQQLKPAAKASR